LIKAIGFNTTHYISPQYKRLDYWK